MQPQRWSCEVRFAADLADVEAVASRDAGFEPDIVLADYHLENGQTGLQAITRLRELWGERLPAIVISADRSPMVVDAAQRAHCEVLRKPVRPAELRALMQHLLS
jgi:CheY-like chemotaxis protein